MRYLHGQYLNNVELALAVTLNPAADANYPATNLQNPDPSVAARHGSNTANPTVTIDQALMTPASSGTTNVVVRAGQRLRITASSGTVQVRNLSTLKYLTSGAAWQVTSANVLSGSGSVNFQVESLDICQVPTVTLAVTVTAGSGVTLWPRWNMLAVVGHNLDVGLTVEARSSTDNFSGSNVLKATMAVKQPSFKSYVTAGVDERYARVAITGTNQAAAWYGKILLLWVETAARAQFWGWSIRRRVPQVRHKTDAGKDWVYPLTAWPVRSLKVSFDRRSSTDMKEARDEWFARALGGSYWSVVEPMDDEDDLLYGRLDESYETRRLFPLLWEDEFIVTEAPITRLL